MNIIGIDNGFGYTKTVHHSFPSGVVAFDNPPYTSKGVLQFDKKYYVCCSGRQVLTKAKTEDDNKRQGLLKFGGAIVPFENLFPKDTLLYKLMTTTLGE